MGIALTRTSTRTISELNLPRHVIENPDRTSFLSMLSGYGPNLPKEILEKLVDLFIDLRKLVDEGVISYPYSLRCVRRQSPLSVFS